MAEVHVVGTLLSARGFEGADALYVKYSLEPRGPHWQLLSGDSDGQSHVVEVTDVRCVGKRFVCAVCMASFLLTL